MEDKEILMNAAIKKLMEPVTWTTTKTLKFNMKNEQEKELFEWLQSLPHGKFTELTKEYWIGRMNYAYLFSKKIEEFERKLNGSKYLHESLDEVVEDKK